MMTLHLSSAASGYSGPPDTQADILREMARKRASDETWNMVHTGMMAAQLASMNKIHGQMEQVKRQNEDALAIQQELLNREQLVQQFSAKSDVPASTRYFLLQSVLAQVEQDGIDTATIRGRENKAAFEQTMASIHRLVATLLKDSEVQDAIRWAEKLEAERREKKEKAIAERAEKQAALKTQLKRLCDQRERMRSKRNPLTFGAAMREWFDVEHCKVPRCPKKLLAALFYMLYPFSLTAICIYRAKANSQANDPIDYQLGVIDTRIAEIESELEHS